MKGFKIGGFKSPSPSPSAKLDTPRPATQAPQSPKPAAKQDTFKDGFDTKARGTSGKPVQQPGQDVTASFTSNPLGFTGNNVLNAYNMFPGGRPHGVELPTAGKPFVPANQSVVGLSVHQHQGNANLSVTPLGESGAKAHYLHYLSSGAGRFAGIDGVPLHPKPGDPSLIVTGPLNGCAVHALHDTKQNTLAFVHQADFSKNGEAALAGFLKERPGLKLVESFKPSNYSHATGASGIETGATSFIHYNKLPNQTEGKWMMVGQLNDWKHGGGAGGRPELVRPQNLPVGSVQTLPLDL